jgi:hypothetical protein
MPKADTSTWTPVGEIANVRIGVAFSHDGKMIGVWAEGKNKPKSGSLLEVVTESGTTKWNSVTITAEKVGL